MDPSPSTSVTHASASPSAVPVSGPAAAVPGPSSALLHGTLFVACFLTLLLEILLTRVLSVVMWYHFTFAVLSVSLLGIAIGAVRSYVRPVAVLPCGAIDARALRLALGQGLNLFAVAAAVPLALLLFVVETPSLSPRGALLLVAHFASCGLPFCAGGWVTATIFRSDPRRVSSLYAVDLLGASLGCVAAIPILDGLGGVGGLLGVGLAAGVGALALALAPRDPCSPRATLALATVVLFAAALVARHAGVRMEVRTVKLNEREEDLPVLEVKWNAHSRLALLDYYDPARPSAYSFLSWGLSARFDGWLPRQYLVTIDGASETPITRFGSDLHAHEYLAWDITALPHHLRPGAKTLVLGAGGGRDVLTALWFGSKDVTGVELNADIVGWVRGRCGEFAGFLYDRSGVRIVVDDGRNFLRSTHERYDILQLSMVDTFAATAAGAYALSENNLYTAEAFDDYLAHLAPGGLLSVNRFFLEPPQQTLRVVTLAREALARRGVADPARSIVAVGLGFSLVEVVLLQRFQLYLGHPVYSLAVVLAGLLASSSLGSAWTRRRGEGGEPVCAGAGAMRVACGLAMALLAAHELTWRAFLNATLGLPLAARIGLTVLALFPLGFALGMPYPLGLRAVATARPDALPWLWAVNAAASVLGTILAFVLALAAGFRSVLVLGGLCYAVALAAARRVPAGTAQQARVATAKAASPGS
ncbi:MAG: hypothetical protein HYZ53_04725 [Planctomycetes bacterium]|nr:hypothetical protein [Planctomycetota bacterium]